MNKKILVLGGAVALLGNSCSVRAHDSDVGYRLLHTLDGSVITPETFGDMIYLCRRLSMLVHGLDPDNLRTKKHNPNCFFQGEPSSPKALAQREEEHLNGTNPYDEKTQHDIATVLNACKEQFVDMTADFLEIAQMMKGFLVELIEEFCEKEGRQDSLLLKWMDLENDEVEMFRQNVLTFEALNQFCADLSHFQHDLMRNCPKASAAWEKQTGRTLPWNKKK